MRFTMANDPIDRDVFLARSGRPHNPVITHLTETHALTGTASYLFSAMVKGERDPDTLQMLKATRSHRDDSPESPTFGCYKWYAEDPNVYDTNASFFICTSLTGLWLAFRDELTAEERRELVGAFADALPWFRRMSENPSFYYPNKCISDAGMLLAAGHILGDEEVTEAGREFGLRYFDYYRRRGTGWGEDHSPVYIRVILEMTLLMMAFEREGELFSAAKRLTDAIVDWALFHDGTDAVPSIRGYNFDCRIEVDFKVDGLVVGHDETPMPDLLRVLRDSSGYRYSSEAFGTPRQRRWRTFDEHFSTSYITSAARLGTLSHYPLMPNTYMHDGWGLGWQTKPCSFILGNTEYGVLEWMSVDDEGVVRQHEAKGSIHDWPSRHLFKRESFHPDVVFTGHQERGAAIVFREIRQLHSATGAIVDRWRLAHETGRLLVGGAEWDGQPTTVHCGEWVVLQCDGACVAIRPLSCRVPADASEDENPQRRTPGSIVDTPLQIESSERGTLLSLSLVAGRRGMLTEHLLFSGWCIVLLEDPEDVSALSVREEFIEDGELPRTYGELIREVELQTPDVTLTLRRDMLTGDVSRLVDGDELLSVAACPDQTFPGVGSEAQPQEGSRWL